VAADQERIIGLGYVEKSSHLAVFSEKIFYETIIEWQWSPPALSGLWLFVLSGLWLFSFSWLFS
jgi:hypothetical protein